MKNKSTTDLRLVNILLIFGMTVALLVSTSSSQMISASVEGGTPVPNTSNSNQQAIDHINQAQSALQNGDTEGANGHLDLAKQALDCNKIIDPNC
jgi:hypothetical protein